MEPFGGHFWISLSPYIQEYTIILLRKLYLKISKDEYKAMKYGYKQTGIQTWMATTEWKDLYYR
jgi:hypothetical protein